MARTYDYVTFCDLCGRWPRVKSEFSDAYCGYCTALCRAWGNEMASGCRLEHRFGRNHWVVRLSVRWSQFTAKLFWILETGYAIRFGGPFNFWPWDALVRAVCRLTAHRPRPIGTGDGSVLWECSYCTGRAMRAMGDQRPWSFADCADYNSIWCGITPLKEGSL